MKIVRAVTDPPAPPTRDGWPVLAVLPLEPEDVPDAPWEDFVTDGLGDTRGAGVEVEGGWTFGLARYLESARPGITVYALTDGSRLPEALDALLAATGLTRADLPWVSPAVP